MNYATSLLQKSHQKKDFCCGKAVLDSYLHHQASQDVKRKLSACFVSADEGNRVLGYYTLSNASIRRELLPEDIRKKLPPAYTDLPATLLGRLAVDNNVKGKKLGTFLLLDALRRSYDISLSIGSIAVLVDPLDEDAEHFYGSFGFVKLPDSGKMFLMMSTIANLFQ
jgi:predicted GNAT family N-acyltransferase